MVAVVTTAGSGITAAAAAAAAAAVAADDDVDATSLFAGMFWRRTDAYVCRQNDFSLSFTLCDLLHHWLAIDTARRWLKNIFLWSYLLHGRTSTAYV